MTSTGTYQTFTNGNGEHGIMGDTVERSGYVRSY